MVVADGRSWAFSASGLRSNLAHPVDVTGVGVSAVEVGVPAETVLETLVERRVLGTLAGGGMA
jgi:hypothetical protein